MIERVGLLALFALTPLLMGMGEIKIDVKKVEKTTMVKGSAVAAMDVSFPTLLQVLCDYDAGGAWSEDDPVELQVAVGQAQSQALLANKPEERDDVVALAKGAMGKTPTACPGGENHVLALLNLPWPLSDTWLISHFRTSVTDSEARISFNFLGGTAKQSSGYWNLRRLADGRTELANHFEFDVGFRIPEFLIKWGVNNALPDFFKDIETYAQGQSAKAGR